jgi:DNA helicase HerA-like ATPase
LGGKNYELKYYDSVKSRAVNWLWYPYIPYGKITIIQGDPGDGKTTFVLNLAAQLTKGASLPGLQNKQEPVTVIYQNAEDGIDDTIKPRLVRVGADCAKVAYLHYDGFPITLADDRIEEAITESGAKLIVFDPLQAYLGDIDMNRANDTRTVLQKIASVADRTGCAVILIGHMNKSDKGKGLYRGLGSIDLAAAARSVLLVGKVKSDPGVRAVVHIKSNLAPEGKPIAFELNDDYGFRWIEGYDISQDELLGDSVRTDDGKTAEAMNLLLDTLGVGQTAASEMFEICKEAGIGARTAEKAKSILGVKSIKSQGKWYWELPTDKTGEIV